MILFRSVLIILILVLAACSMQRSAKEAVKYTAKQYENLRSKRDYQDIKVTRRDFIFRKHRVVGNLKSQLCRTAFSNKFLDEDDLIEDMQKKALKIGVLVHLYMEIFLKIIFLID